jgi:hypothetical protein
MEAQTEQLMIHLLSKDYVLIVAISGEGNLAARAMTLTILLA